MSDRIITNHVYPPIPMRSWDWSAVRDGYEPPDPIGWGSSEKEAIADLLREEQEASIVHTRTCPKLDESGAFNCGCGASAPTKGE